MRDGPVTQSCTAAAPGPSPLRAVAELPFPAIALLLAIALAAWVPSARADVFHLKDGSEVEGQVLLEKPDRYWLRTATGARWLATADVARITRKATVWERYESARKNFPMSAVGQFELAMWCGQNALTAEREKHLRMSVGLDPAFEPACVALGYTKQGDRWVPPRREAEPPVVPIRPVPMPIPVPPTRPEGPPPTIPTLPGRPDQPVLPPPPVPPGADPRVDARRAEADARARNLWAFQIGDIVNTGLRRLDPAVQIEAVRKLEAIADPLAVDGMIENLAAAKEPDFRRLAARLISRFRSDRAALQLVVMALTDSDEQVAEEARRSLRRVADARILPLLRAGLRGPEDLADRCAATLGSMGDLDSVPALVEVLSGRSRLSSDKDPDSVVEFLRLLQKSLGATAIVLDKDAALLSEEAKQHLFGAGGPAGRRHKQPTEFRFRAEVQAALVAIAAGEKNFGFDRSAWTNWYERRKSQVRAIGDRPR